MIFDTIEQAINGGKREIQKIVLHALSDFFETRSEDFKNMIVKYNHIMTISEAQSKIIEAQEELANNKAITGPLFEDIRKAAFAFRTGGSIKQASKIEKILKTYFDEDGKAKPINQEKGDLKEMYEALCNDMERLVFNLRERKELTSAVFIAKSLDKYGDIQTD